MSMELYSLKIDHVKFVNDSEINIDLENTTNNGKRGCKIFKSGSFDCVRLVKKYNELANKVDARKEGKSFFITYRMGVCVNSRMGRNRFREIFKEVATLLKLPHPERYTGHCGRRTSASICATKGATEVQLKSLGGWKHLKMACRYVAECGNGFRLQRSWCRFESLLFPATRLIPLLSMREVAIPALPRRSSQHAR